MNQVLFHNDSFREAVALLKFALIDTDFHKYMYHVSIHSEYVLLIHFVVSNT